MSDKDDEAAERRAYVKRKLEDPDQGLPVFVAFMAAAMAGGMSAKKASAEADLALAEVAKRFT